MSASVEHMPTANLVIWLQKFAKDISIVRPWFRAVLLEEAAKRLNDYRQAERQAERQALVCPVCDGFGHLGPATDSPQRDYGRTCPECDGAGIAPTPGHPGG